MFENYFNEIIKCSDKQYHCYMGISKKEYPKWQGWKIINQYKKNGIHVKEIDDEDLIILVRNFYYLKWLEQY